MELLGLVQQAFQGAAECVASYRLGQLMLRHMDRALWVLEKSARWAVPPPLDQDERPSQELVRPLPWLPFLVLLTALRLVRESVSIFNLVVGKPPLHAADIVMFLQSKRRYLRALKYQGSRAMRARRADAARGSWLSGLTSLFEFTMCFRQRAEVLHSANADNEEILVVRRKHPKKEQAEDGGSGDVDRLIERMMVDLNTDSDDDSSYTLTNVTSVKSCSGSDPDSENESTLTGGAPDSPRDSVPSSAPLTPTTAPDVETKATNDVSLLNVVVENASTPIKERPKVDTERDTTFDTLAGEVHKSEAASAKKESPASKSEASSAEKGSAPSRDSETSPPKTQAPTAIPKATSTKPEAHSATGTGSACFQTEERLLNAGGETETIYSSPKRASESFIAGERAPQRKTPKRAQKLVNGKAILSTPSGKRGMSERDLDVPAVRVTPAEDSAPEDEDYARKPHHNNH